MLTGPQGPMTDVSLAVALHEQRKEKVVAFYTRCHELGIGFGDEVIMAAKIDALIDTLFGPHQIDPETGELLVGSVERVTYEISVAERLLELATDAGLEAASKSPLIVPPPLNREQRRQMQRRK